MSKIRARGKYRIVLDDLGRYCVEVRWPGWRLIGWHFARDPEGRRHAFEDIAGAEAYARTHAQATTVVKDLGELP